MFSNSEQCWRRDLLYDQAVSNNRTAIKMIHGISANERSVSASRESCDSRELSIDESEELCSIRVLTIQDVSQILFFKASFELQFYICNFLFEFGQIKNFHLQQASKLFRRAFGPSTLPKGRRYSFGSRFLKRFIPACIPRSCWSHISVTRCYRG